MNDEEKKRARRLIQLYYGSGATEQQGKIPEPEIARVDSARVDYSIVSE